MNGGRLQQYGAPSAVYTYPANRMVADFMGLVNLVPGEVRDVAGSGVRVVAAGIALEIAALDGLRPGTAVDVAIRPEDIRLTALASEASGQRGDSKARAHSASEDARERADGTPPELGSSARAADGAAAQRGKITNHVFLGNISEYYATLPGGQVLRVQTHPRQRFAVGDEVAIEVDATQCSVFPRG
jgi:ABC-type Fe3+/spermidine/putrescine transport system ATPase subunit